MIYYTVLLNCVTENIQVTEGRTYSPRKQHVDQPNCAECVNKNQAHAHTSPHHHRHRPDKHHSLDDSLITAVRYLYIRHSQLS
jgi:hypothetical protein